MTREEKRTWPRNRNFKIRLTDAEAAELAEKARAAGTSKADFARATIFGLGATERLPAVDELRRIAQILAGIGNNLNQAQKSVNEATANRTLTQTQFAALHTALTKGAELWAEPLADLRHQIKRR